MVKTGPLFIWGVHLPVRAGKRPQNHAVEVHAVSWRYGLGFDTPTPSLIEKSWMFCTNGGFAKLIAGLRTIPGFSAQCPEASGSCGPCRSAGGPGRCPSWTAQLPGCCRQGAGKGSRCSMPPARCDRLSKTSALDSGRYTDSTSRSGCTPF